jgi:F-type H+-transporting ATPase subunit epsilon
MADQLHVDIVTPVASAFSGLAEEIRVPGWLGEFDILPGHDLFLSLVRGGLLTLVTDGQERQFVIGRGFAEAGPDQVTVLCDSCVPTAAADLGSAAADLEAAERTLAHSAAESPEWLAAEEAAELARGRLAAR